MSASSSDLEFVIRNTFYKSEPYRGYYYGIGGERIEIDVDEFYWRSCTLSEDEFQGSQGYMMVWLNEDGSLLEQHHTYRHPLRRTLPKVEDDD